ncbi:MAG: bifunctional diaminohydroxyphosphoribosylaminopyrimidine deaminase/5-amino-6-(5-phosphoribosylamino)uracil reductase RibD [Desulfobacteraceae bacterium]|nr:bifunctional diaminohydroxyphosphoribosylaminopyrimidine deaminase/5-amino-6-(5-phosphoribosylamino)uracil reductase RibD [Desulfobacteraceae bacterium]
MMNDANYMRMALDLAAKGAGYVSPNPMVGAVVVNDDRVVGRGWHQEAGKAHAEVNALDDAAALAAGATLYVTLEPCNHHGRTPACTEKILKSGIKRVVTAMADPNPDVRGGGNSMLRENGVVVSNGVCEKEARKLNEAFIKFVKTKKPFVVLKLAATLDGRIATRTGDARWVTGPAARAQVHHLRHVLDAIMVGRGTVATDDPQLTARLENGLGKDPVRFVLDTRLRTSEHAKLLQQQSEVPTYLIHGPCDNRQVMERLAGKGARFLEAAVRQGRIDLEVLMAQLGKMNITSLLIEGGAGVAGSALSAGIVDKVIFFYAPKIVGGDDGIPMIKGRGVTLMQDALTLGQIMVQRVGDDIMVEGYCSRN